MIMIGIDPGVQTGMAVWDCHGQDWVCILTVDFWSCYHDVQTLQFDRKLVVIEDPSKNKPVFSRPGQSARKMQRIAQNVGSNKREGTLLIAGFRQAGIPVQAIRPTTSKWTRQTFGNITGYRGRTSQHARDAARMVFGRPAMPSEQYNQLIKQRAL